jgi:hypothetical protein
MSRILKLFSFHNLRLPLDRTLSYTIGLLVAILLTAVDALNFAYYTGYLMCSDSPAYSACLGIMSHHGSYLQYVNSMRLQIVIAMFVCTIALLSRRKGGLLLSLIALAYALTVYIRWYRRTLADMSELEVPTFEQLQGTQFQQLIPLRYSNWVDVSVLIACLFLLLWYIVLAIRSRRA